MNRILVRSTPSPADTVTPREAWEKNVFHNNTGNVAFPYGLFRNLVTQDTEVESDWYGSRLPDPAEVNEKYSHYILPMANDMGGHFAGEMRKMTAFIKKLRIPTVLVGIGGAFSIDEKFERSFPFDKTVRDFIRAILDRSATVGLRGEISGRYLKHLGFKEGSDYQVIGDPTLYDLGPNLKIRELADVQQAQISYNMTPKAPQPALEFLTKLAREYDSSIYIPQDIGEFSKYYYGMMDPTANTVRDTTSNFPKDLRDLPYYTGRIRFFFDFVSWASYMRSQDLSVGTRIHGNIIPTYAGTPSLTLAYGSRLKELAEYHNLPHMEASNIDTSKSLEDLVGEFDFQSPERVHAENFARYVDFLNRNGVEHLYGVESRDHLPFDDKVAQREDYNLEPITALDDLAEIRHRLADGFEVSQNKIVAQKARLDRLKTEVTAQRSKLNQVQEFVDGWK